MVESRSGGSKSSSRSSRFYKAGPKDPKSSVRLHRKVYGCWVWVCQKVTNSRAFSFLTTVLTVYALFGDDMRLIFTDKSADENLNYMTFFCMAIFSLEVIVFIFGKHEYWLGFFFWLDCMATVTLVLDISFISESMFGDQISKAASTSGEADSSSAGSDSADAARAARMSRAGTKAGRVVRLVRLVRLLRLLKNQKKGEYQAQEPGAEWDDDEEQANGNESAVSKKLSEMTTRRVIVLVLVIMLALPFFTTSMYMTSLPTGSEYGVNHLYRSWRASLAAYDSRSSTSSASYESLPETEAYRDDFYQFVYYHNPFCKPEEVPTSAVATPLSQFGRIFWVGAAPPDSELGRRFFPKLPSGSSVDLNARWNGQDWAFHQCNLTAEPQKIFDVEWDSAQLCINDKFRGLSLLAAGGEPGLVCPEQLRYMERKVVTPLEGSTAELEEFHWLFVFDRRAGSQLEAFLNTMQTVFICLLLGFGSMLFSNDANTLVLMPIERMIVKIEKIRKNPLAAMTIQNAEQRKEELEEQRRRADSGWETRSVTSDSTMASRDVDSNPSSRSERPERPHRRELLEMSDGSCRGEVRRLWRKAKKAWKDFRKGEKKPAPEPMETVVLEKTIIKIGQLLALGFGEAGAGIIAQQMGGESSTLNSMIPGRRVEAIFCLCTIRNFPDATEVLQEHIMLFVNRIADIVHTCTSEFYGSPNRNMGDSFLLSWCLTDHEEDKRERVCDLALVCVAKIIAQINKSPNLAEYRSHPKLLRRFPNYRVRMGFGLHCGWAIEGAIGSEFKIDASYLGPNLNLVAELEAATKLYGVLVLVSDAMHSQLSPGVRSECRLIDYVRIWDFPQEFRLHCLDLDDFSVDVVRRDKHGGGKNSKREKFRQRRDMMQRRAERWADDFDVHEYFTHQDVDIVRMRHRYSAEFLARFSMAYQNYEAGQWEAAEGLLQEVIMLPGVEDGPSRALLEIMEAHGGEAPADWAGWHDLFT
mmetsp:Transcript_34086/g.101268  ORF Transcript_34086/g.101268 Transcript_34086/m.101268 type:complete len:980 (-) Transcript_34086:46-2985(-)